MFLELLNIIGVPALISGLAVYIGKPWIENAITNKYSKDIEILKSELKLVEAKQNVVFSKLHNDRADVIAKIYDLLKEVHLNAQRYMKPFEFAGEESKETYLLNANKAWNEFVDYYPKKMIYLPKPTANKLENVVSELQTLFSTYQIVTNSFPAGTDMQQEINNVLNQTPTILDTLEDDFRKLLGYE